MRRRHRPGFLVLGEDPAECSAWVSCVSSSPLIITVAAFGTLPLWMLLKRGHSISLVSLSLSEAAQVFQNTLINSEGQQKKINFKTIKRRTVIVLCRNYLPDSDLARTSLLPELEVSGLWSIYRFLDKRAKEESSIYSFQMELDYMLIGHLKFSSVAHMVLALSM